MRYLIRQDPNGDSLHDNHRVRVLEIADTAKLHAAPSVKIYEAKTLAEFKAAQGVTDFTPPPPVPQSVTPLQMRLALNEIGWRDEVDAAVDKADQSVRDAWEYALEIRRDNALLAALTAAIGKTSAQVDDLFRLAGKKA